MSSTEAALPNFSGRLSGSMLVETMEHGDGLATFECDSEEEFLEAALTYGAPMSHRDADERNITHLRDVVRPGKERGLGFTSDALLPHTDRPAIPSPPRVLLLWCRSGSTEGGEATALRASDVAARLGEIDSAALQAFSAQDAAIFRTGDDERTCPVFEMRDGEVVQVRLRFDPHVYFAVDAARSMPSLMRALRDTESVFALEPGKGYALRNDLWLHGRRAFSGDREMLRMMIGSCHSANA